MAIDPWRLALRLPHVRRTLLDANDGQGQNQSTVTCDGAPLSNTSTYVNDVTVETLAEEQIGGLDVAMYETARVNVLEATQLQYS